MATWTGYSISPELSLQSNNHVRTAHYTNGNITVAYLCNFVGNSISQHFPVEALLGHVIGEAAGSLEGIFQPLQFHIGHYRRTEKEKRL